MKRMTVSMSFYQPNRAGPTHLSPFSPTPPSFLSLPALRNGSDYERLGMMLQGKVGEKYFNSNKMKNETSADGPKMK